MKKRFLAVLATGLFLVGMGGEAQALIIDYTKFTLTSPDDALILYGNESSQSLITKAINDFFTPDLIELYKADYNPPLVESGDLSGSYDIVFSNTVNDPRNATITSAIPVMPCSPAIA